MIRIAATGAHLHVHYGGDMLANWLDSGSPLNCSCAPSVAAFGYSVDQNQV